ncbi:MAG: hypothetical protein N2689_14920, partial [Verrucomicrobiae bacterium]|nr:hypothetical protein [Verrucomicrobiae bacterium]
SLDIAAEPDGICYDAMRKRIYVSCGSGSLDVIQQLDANHYALPAEFPPRRARAHRSLCRNWIPCI